MAKSKQQHEKAIVEVIKKYKVMFISHIFGYYTDLKISQFYNLKLEKSEIIKEAIQENRCKASGYLINKWIGSENATLQVAAYKLICNDEERRRLTMEHVKADVDVSDKRELTALEAKEFIEKLKKEV